MRCFLESQLDRTSLQFSLTFYYRDLLCVGSNVSSVRLWCGLISNVLILQEE